MIGSDIEFYVTDAFIIHLDILPLVSICSGSKGEMQRFCTLKVDPIRTRIDIDLIRPYEGYVPGSYHKCAVVVPYAHLIQIIETAKIIRNKRVVVLRPQITLADPHHSVISPGVCTTRAAIAFQAAAIDGIIRIARLPKRILAGNFSNGWCNQPSRTGIDGKNYYCHKNQDILFAYH